MINVTEKLQRDIKTIMIAFDSAFNEAADLENLYFKGTVSADVGGLGAGAPATVTSKLDKEEVINSLTMFENLRKFFDGVAVAQSDYNNTIQNVLHGDAVLATALSIDVENFGDRSKVLAQILLDQYNRARDAENDYVNLEISAAVAGISTQTVVFGSDMTKDDLTSAITMLQEYKNYIENSVVATATYKATLAKWKRL